MNRHYKNIVQTLQNVSIACETIRRVRQCRGCPLEKCLEYDTFEEFAEAISADAMEKFFILADDITDAEEEQSKTEEQKRWDAEADEWNVRRCDPKDW